MAALPVQDPLLDFGRSDPRARAIALNGALQLLQVLRSCGTTAQAADAARSESMTFTHARY